MRSSKLVLILVPALLGGCDRADVKACEEFVRSGLVSPSSYRLVDSQRYINTGSKEEKDSLSIDLQYDAFNKAGVAIRSNERCSWGLDAAGKPPADDVIWQRARSAIARRDMWVSMRQGAFGERNAAVAGKDPPQCCD